jgi:hypothetical protein
MGLEKHQLDLNSFLDIRWQEDVTGLRGRADNPINDVSKPLMQKSEKSPGRQKRGISYRLLVAARLQWTATVVPALLFEQSMD